MTFVPEVNLDSLKAFLKKAEKKAQKYGRTTFWKIQKYFLNLIPLRGNVLANKNVYQILIPVCRITEKLYQILIPVLYLERKYILWQTLKKESITALNLYPIG